MSFPPVWRSHLHFPSAFAGFHLPTYTCTHKWRRKTATRTTFRLRSCKVTPAVSVYSGCLRAGRSGLVLSCKDSANLSPNFVLSCLIFSVWLSWWCNTNPQLKDPLWSVDKPSEKHPTTTTITTSCIIKSLLRIWSGHCHFKELEFHNSSRIADLMTIVRMLICLKLIKKVRCFRVGDNPNFLTTSFHTQRCSSPQFFYTKLSKHYFVKYELNVHFRFFAPYFLLLLRKYLFLQHVVDVSVYLWKQHGITA